MPNIIKRLFATKVEPETGATFVPPEEPTYYQPRSIGSPVPEVHVLSGEEPSTEDKRLSKDKAHEIAASSITKFQGETFNPYYYSLYRGLSTYTEPSLYRDYEESWRQNSFTNMVVEYIINEVFANGYHFEGPGANVIQQFWDLDDTDSKLKMSFRESVKKGNGFMDMGAKGGTLARTRCLPTDDIQIELDPKTGTRIYKQGNTKLKNEYMIHLMIREEVANPYGISLLRSNLVFLTALMDVGGDIMAALKRTAYSPMLVKLDLSGYDEATKDVKVRAFQDKLKNINSATNNIVIDSRHDVGLLGQGAAGARLLPTNDLIEPIISVVLMNFGMPIGLFLQTGANKSIIDEQRKAMRRFTEDLRNKVKHQVEKKIIPMITKRECKMVFNQPPLDTEEQQNLFRLQTDAFSKGLLSREFVLEHWDWDDTGKTFAQTGGDKDAGSSSDTAKPKEESVEDGKPKGKRKL